MSLSIGSSAPDFSLPGVDGETWSLSSFAEKPVLVVIFSCNHCPYVVAYEERMTELQRDYAERGVQLVAINPNNEKSHPADSFDKMVQRAKDRAFNFPYLRDESQDVARAYGARFTPEIFAFDKDRKLAYHGRIDDNYDDPFDVRRHDLREALDEILAGKPVSIADTEPVGCTVKWK